MALAPTSISHSQEQSPNYTFAFSIVTGLFFIWGFTTCLNDILIPFLKKLFILSYFQATLVQFSFFGAYFIGSLIYFFSSFKYGDPIARIGYKNCIIAGLLFSVLGCIIFYPAAALKLYPMFLCALFILGLGFTLLQIAANPYVAILGNQEGASSRLNLAQGVNSLGTTIAPLIGGYFLFGHNQSGNDDLSEGVLEQIYLLFSAIFLGLALLFKFIPLPAFKSNGEPIKGAGALRFPHLIIGAMAIFTYVGGEVSIGSLLISFLKLPNIAALTESEGSKYVAFYWAGLMVGRFVGAVSLNHNLERKRKIALIVFIPIAAFIGTAILTDWLTAIHWGLCLLLNLIAFWIGSSLPSRTLGWFAVFVVMLLFVSILGNGLVAMWSLIAIGLFNSIFWSNIFTLSIKNLGVYTSQGSSLLIMAILGAATIPVLQGAMADAIGLQFSFFIPMLCYIFLIYYGFKGYKAGMNTNKI